MVAHCEELTDIMPDGVGEVQQLSGSLRRDNETEYSIGDSLRIAAQLIDRPQAVEVAKACEGDQSSTLVAFPTGRLIMSLSIVIQTLEPTTKRTCTNSFAVLATVSPDCVT